MKTAAQRRQLNRFLSAGSITEAVRAAKSVAGFALRIDVECTSEAEAIEAIEAGADVIMLDNFTPQEISESSVRLKQKYSDRRFLIEVSGGVTEDNIAAHVFQGALELSLPLAIPEKPTEERVFFCRRGHLINLSCPPERAAYRLLAQDPAQVSNELLILSQCGNVDVSS